MAGALIVGGAAAEAVPTLTGEPPAAAPRALVAGANGSPGPLPVPTVPASSPSGEWYNVTSGIQPSARSFAAMAYDPSIPGMVLEGGWDVQGQVPRNDTWEYSGGVWHNVTQSVNGEPPSAYEATLTYDAGDDYLMLVGGSSAGANADPDVWSFAHNRWASISTLPQDLRSDALSATYDSSDGYVLVLGCSSGLTTTHVTYSWTAGTWDRRATTGMSGCGGTLVDDPAGHQVLLFGGNSGFAATWAYSAGVWTNISATAGTPPGKGSSLAHETGLGCYDAAAGEPILVFNDRQLPWVPRTYAFNGTWVDLSSTSIHPAADFFPTFAYDGSTESCLLENAAAGDAWVWSDHPQITNVNISATPNPVDPGARVSFSAGWSGGIPPYTTSWNYGDGSSPSSTSSHSYSASGTFVVTLTVADHANDTENGSTSVVVETVPISPPGGRPNPTDVGLATQFLPGVSASGPPAVELWRFGDGAVSNLSAPYHTYAAPGNYAVIATLNDGRGTIYKASFVEVVDPALRVTLTVSDLLPALGQRVNFSALVEGGTAPYQLRWVFGDGAVAGNVTNTSHAYSTNGPFVPTVWATDAVGASSMVSQWLPILLNVTVRGNETLGAAPLVVGFVSMVSGGVPGFLFVWDFGDGGTNRSPDPSHTYEVPGNYTARLTVVDSVGSVGVSTWTVTIASGIGPLRAALTAFPPGIPEGASTLLTGWAEGGSGAYTIDWASGGLTCLPSGPLNLTCSAGGSGTFVVTMTVTDEGGATVNASVTIVFGSSGARVVPPPPPLSILTSPSPRSWELAAFVLATLLFGTSLGLTVVSAIGAVSGHRYRRRQPPS